MTDLKVGLIGVYRSQHYANLAAVKASFSFTSACFWALDASPVHAAASTLGSGPGGRLAHLNRIHAQMPADLDFLVICDDDVRLTRGNIAALLEIMNAGALDIAQPAHDRMSNWSHPITIAEEGCTYRLTTFVEAGPLVALSRLGRGLVFPLPEGWGMGWGVELLWADTRATLGIVDAVRMRHLAPVAHDYDASAEHDRVRRLLVERGHTNWSSMQSVKRRVRPDRSSR
ncbi:hypothetical protein E4P41_20665 [Geodermatophilus sp. DF01-2]|uniref:hypothetical protein n=1 Tax=Geodermatophilus sp. DF01-2 TaxID=2559610 RepID=UPI0010730294|nr:hypothetical protein [Geodermatophilus sp. DF01_2]TFV53881.1 hypothetical protein E4P41_20665 [Geodermatophilus sp. DF01_2]